MGQNELFSFVWVQIIYDLICQTHIIVSSINSGLLMACILYLFDGDPFDICNHLCFLMGDIVMNF